MIHKRHDNQPFLSILPAAAAFGSPPKDPVAAASQHSLFVAKHGRLHKTQKKPLRGRQDAEQKKTLRIGPEVCSPTSACGGAHPFAAHQAQEAPQGLDRRAPAEWGKNLPEADPQPPSASPPSAPETPREAPSSPPLRQQPRHLAAKANLAASTSSPARSCHRTGTQLRGALEPTPPRARGAPRSCLRRVFGSTKVPLRPP